MPQIHIDCQGLPCPQPVLKCKNTIEEQSPDFFSITVDNEAAKENVSRFASTQGYEVATEDVNNEYLITMTKNNDKTAECQACEVMNTAQLAQIGDQKTLVFLASDVIGSGDDELGAKLMQNFLLTLNELGEELWRIIMLNGAVKLAVPGNPAMETLKKLEDAGVSILVCGTCLEHFGLTGKNGVGQVTNMLDVVTSFQLASKTIRV